MKRTPLFIFSIILSLHAHAQNNQWFQPGHEWYYDVYCFSDFACGYKHYAVTGDTLLLDREGVILSVNTLEDFGETNSEILIVSINADTVFRYSPEAERWHMLYDLGAEAGDVWTIQEDTYFGYGEDPGSATPLLFRVEVTGVDSVEVMGELRRRLTTEPWMNDTLWSDFHFGHQSAIVAGIGPVDGAHGLIGQPTIELLPLQSPSFQCFLEGGILTFGSADAPCNTLSTMGDLKPLRINMYPNPVTDRLFIELPEEGANAWQLRIFDLHGKMVFAKNGFVGGKVFIDELPPGMYLLQATDHTQRIVVRKFVKE